MALLLFDSMGDQYSAGAFPSDSIWTSNVNATITASGQNVNGVTITPAAGAFGNLGVPGISLLNNPTTGGSVGFGAGIAFYVASVAGGINTIPLMQIGNGATYWTFSATLGSSSWRLQMADNASNTIVGQFTFQAATWYYAEFLVSSLQAGNTVTMRLGGTTAAIGQMQTSIPDNPLTTVYIGGPSWGTTNVATVIYDNFYAFTTQVGSGLVTSLLGPVVSSVLTPAGAGRVTQFTPLSGSNYNNVNSIPPPGDTHYNSGNAVGITDAYTLSSLPGGLGPIYGVQPTASARNTVSGRTLSIGIGNGSSEVYGNTLAPGTSYTMGFTCYDTNPFTSAQFVSGDFSTLQAAVQIAS